MVISIGLTIASWSTPAPRWRSGRLGLGNGSPPDERSDVIKSYNALIAAKGEPFEKTESLGSATGKYRTFFTKAAPLYDSAGNIVQWFGTNTDIQVPGDVGP
ncbi:MAG: hypothetical protein WDZ30_03935 [Cellvibrionaceae bacterium]